MTPIQIYQKHCETGLIHDDPEQRIAMQLLNDIYESLMKEDHHRTQFFQKILKKKNLVKGAYLWGGVGIGKTFMMDCFFESLTFPEKLRMHFHQFVQLIHSKLKEYQGKKNPLDKIADEFADQFMILCFDELFVSDITDAMLLGKLFKALFSRGVTLVTTSNTQPDDLYKNGLQREQFLPAIDALKEHTTVLHIPTSIDYRLRHLKNAGVFYTPLDAAAAQNMEKTFEVLATGKVIIGGDIEVCGRKIKIKKMTDDIVWFDFSEICTVPRSQSDYLAIAERFRTVFISDIPDIAPEAKDTICLFITLVDVFYDAKVKLVISAAEPVEQLYSRGYMILEYTRTHSRLLEMQSMDYFDNDNTIRP